MEEKKNTRESNDFQAKGLKFFKKEVVNNVKCYTNLKQGKN